MNSMDGWDWALLIAVAYTAVMVLVRLMVRRRNELHGYDDCTTAMRPLERHNVVKRTPHTAVNVSPEDCQFLIVQGPGKYDFIRLAKLDS